MWLKMCLSGFELLKRVSTFEKHDSKFFAQTRMFAWLTDQVHIQTEIMERIEVRVNALTKIVISTQW